MPGHEWAEILPGIIEGHADRNGLVAIPIEPTTDAVAEAPFDAVTEEVG